jgi:hypothetical protein
VNVNDRWAVLSIILGVSGKWKDDQQNHTEDIPLQHQSTTQVAQVSFCSDDDACRIESYGYNTFR